MKAVVANQYGPIEDLVIQQVAEPSVLPGQVKIQVECVSVNPVEWKIVEGLLDQVFSVEFPLIIGWDVSGVVVELGEGVHSLSVGDQVYSFCRAPVVQNGTFAEFCCFAAEQVVLKPKNIGFAESAAIPLVGLTAWQVLYDIVQLQKGQTCLIHAGAGGVGSIAIPLAHHTGAWVATTASAKNHPYVKELGADLAIDYRNTSFVSAVKDLYPEGLDFVFDCVGADTLEKSYELVKKGGWLVSIAAPIDKERAENLGIQACTGMVRSSGEQLKKLTELLENGTIAVPEVEKRPLSDVVSALQQIKSQHTKGKIVLQL